MKIDKQPDTPNPLANGNDEEMSLSFNLPFEDVDLANATPEELSLTLSQFRQFEDPKIRDEVISQIMQMRQEAKDDSDVDTPQNT